MKKFTTGKKILDLDKNLDVRKNSRLEINLNLDMKKKKIST